MRDRNARSECCIGSPQKGIILECERGHADAARNIIEDAGASCGVIGCILSAGHVQASHRSGESPYRGESAIMLRADTKKRCTHDMEITIIPHAMSIRLVEGGASEGCPPKLPRSPFGGSSCTQVSGTAVHGRMVGSPA